MTVPFTFVLTCDLGMMTLFNGPSHISLIIPIFRVSVAALEITMIPLPYYRRFMMRRATFSKVLLQELDDSVHAYEFNCLETVANAVISFAMK